MHQIQVKRSKHSYKHELLWEKTMLESLYNNELVEVAGSESLRLAMSSAWDGQMASKGRA